MSRVYARKRFMALPTAPTEAEWDRNKECLIDEVLVQAAASTSGVTPEMRRAYASFL